MRSIPFLTVSSALLLLSSAGAVKEPVAQWSMDDKIGYATDSSGNQHTGTLEGTYADAVFSDVAQVGSGSLQCTIGGGTRMNGGTVPGSAGSISLAFWAKANSVIYSTPMGKMPFDNSGKGWRVLFRNNGEIWFSIGSSGENNVNCRASAAYSVDAWVHVTCTFGNGTSKIYVDGILKDTETGITQTVNDTVSDLCVGHLIGESASYTFDGLIDEVRIYDSVLTATEIADLADADYYETENQAPAVDAGLNHTVWAPVYSVALDATVTDDGLPLTPGTVSCTWANESGPSPVTFSSTNSVDTLATFGSAGTYVLKLSATDGARTRSDFVTVEVFGTIANKAPIAHAGSDQTIWLPVAILELTGHAMDDGGAENLTLSWSKLSGPGTVTFSSADIANPEASFDIAGDYVLQLEATDGTFSGTDTVTVTVIDPDQSIDIAGWWTMDGNGTDSSGNNHDGTLQNGAGYSTEYKVGSGSLETTGSSGSRLNCGTVPGSAEALTVAFWANPSKLSFADAVGKYPYRNASNNNGWLVMFRSNGDWWFRVGGPAGNSYIQAGVATPTNAWSHIACTFEDGTARIYVNGELKRSSGVSYEVDDVVTDLQIGHSDGASYGYTFPGLIDDVAIYDAALEPGVIADIYSNGVMMSVNTAPVPDETIYGYPVEVYEEHFDYELTLDYDAAGQAPESKSAPPAPYAHPRILFGPEDLNGIRLRLKSTDAGRWQMFKLKTEISQRLTDTDATYRDVYDDLIAGTTDSYRDLYNQWTDARPVVELMMKEAFRCLIEVDVAAAADVADATETLAEIMQTQLLPTTSWQNWSQIVVMHNYTGLLYDFIYPWMTETQRAKMRSVLAGATAGMYSIGMNSVKAPPANTSNWIPWVTGDLLLTILAIEGEEGYDVAVYNETVEAYKAFMTFGVYADSGATFEPIGKNALAAQNLIAMSKRGENIVASKSAKHHIENYYLYAMMPWGYGWTWFDDWGGPDIAARMTDVATLKYAFPDNAAIDFMWRNATGEDYSGLKIDSAGYGEVLATAAFIRDWDQSKTWNQALSNAVDGLPLTFFCKDRGHVITRSSWDADALQLHFKPSSVPGGHTHADRNVFTFNALGRVWGGYPHSSVEQRSRYHSVVLIDGAGQGNSKTPPGIMMDFADTDHATFATGDAYWAYAKVWGGWGSLIDKSWNDFRYDTNGPNESWMNLPWSELPDWQYNRRGSETWSDWNPVERAFRTAGLVRGDHPWALIIDDIQKDASSHTYQWLMRLPDDLVSSVSINGLDVTLIDPDSGTRCLVRALAVNGAASWSVNSTDKTLVLSTTTVAPDFKVMLYPYSATDGDPIPETSWSGSELTVTIGSQTDQIEFQMDEVNKTTFSLNGSFLMPPNPSGIPVPSMQSLRVENETIHISWTGGTDSIQRIMSADEVSGPWLPRYTNYPPTAVTNIIELPMSSQGSQFFKLEAELP